jgi:hypothetical protein
LCNGCLSRGRSSGSRGSRVSQGTGGVDVAAEQTLAQKGNETALGLLADVGTAADESVDGSGCDGSWSVVSSCSSAKIKIGTSESLTSSAVEVGEVQDIGGAAQGRARCAEGSLTPLERSSDGSDGESEDGGEEHLDCGDEVGYQRIDWKVVVSWVDGVDVAVG